MRDRIATLRNTLTARGHPFDRGIEDNSLRRTYFTQHRRSHTPIINPHLRWSSSRFQGFFGVQITCLSTRPKGEDPVE